MPLGRADDMIILGNGLKVNALSFETLLDAQPGVMRSAVLATPDNMSIMALIQSSPKKLLAHREAASIVATVNLSFSSDKRVPLDNVYIVPMLPITTKLTLHRKRLKVILKGVSGVEEVIRRIEGLVPQRTSKEPGSVVKPVENVQKKEAAAAPTPTSTTTDIETLSEVAKALSSVLDAPLSHFLNPSLEITNLSLSSIAMVRVAKALKEKFGIDVPPARMYGLKTIGDICQLVRVEKTEASGATIADNRELSSTSDSGPAPLNDALVISGISLRLPRGINTLSLMWEALNAPDLFISIPSKRPESRWKSSPETETKSKTYPSLWLENLDIEAVESFATFFGMMPSDVRAMTPNARISLLLGYEAIQDAGIAPKSLGGKNWGVFTALNDSGWRERLISKTDIEGVSVLPI